MLPLEKCDRYPLTIHNFKKTHNSSKFNRKLKQTDKETQKGFPIEREKPRKTNKHYGSIFEAKTSQPKERWWFSESIFPIHCQFVPRAEEIIVINFAFLFPWLSLSWSRTIERGFQSLRRCQPRRLIHHSRYIVWMLWMGKRRSV